MKILLLLFSIFIYYTNEHGHGHNHHDHAHAHKSKSTYILENIRRIPGSGIFIQICEHLIDDFNRLEILYQILIAVAFISVIPIIFLALIPVSQHEESIILKLMVAFSAGCLLGEAFLHLIPHTYQDHKGRESEIGGYILLGIFIFYAIEKILKNIKSCEAVETPSVRQKMMEDVLKIKAYKSGHKVGGVPDIGLQQICTHTHGSKCSAALNLIADSAHNFMDGMAIASTFMMSPVTGVATTISVFFHEIPHEISDYAILLNAGFSPFKAMMFQLITSCGAFSGAIITYYLGRALEQAHSYVIPSLTAGGFIYISCVNIVPCILSSQGSATHFMAESASILAGTLVLTLLD